MSSKRFLQRARRPAILLLVLVLFVVAYLTVGRSLSREKLADYEASLVTFRAENPLLVYGLAFLIYVGVTGLSVPGATLMTLVMGWYFGFWRALILISFASTGGATLAFLLSRYLFRDAVQRRFGDRLETFHQALRREGAFYLFTLRLIPAVPFFVINLVMGLTPMRTRTFWWVSQLGMLPGTCIYIFAGSRISLQEIAERGAGGVLRWDVAAALVALGVFPLAVKKILARLRPQTVEKLKTDEDA